MLTSYKRKIYTGKNITWNQLVDKSKFQNILSLSGISVTNNNDGSIMFDGTKTKSDAVFFSCGTYQITANHKYYLYGAPEGSGNRIYQLYSVFTPTGGSAVYSFDNGSGVFFSGQATASGSGNLNIIISQNTVSKIVFTPQLFDLTLMFGVGNEPTTPAEFWSHFGRKYYPYNVGESQPLFLIGRKNKVFQKTKNLLQIPTTRGYPSDTAFTNTTKRTWTTGTYVVGAQSGNYYDPGSVDSYEIISQGIKIASRYSYGVGFVENLKTGSTYTISYNLITAGVATYEIVFYSQDGSRISATANRTFIVPDDAVWSIIIFKTNAGAEATFSNIQLEEGSAATSYEPYGYLQSIKSKIQEG